MQLIIYVSGALLLALSLFNTWKYLIKKGRYREVSDLLFYMNTAVIIPATLWSSAQMPTPNICSIGWLVPAWATAFLNLNLGIWWTVFEVRAERIANTYNTVSVCAHMELHIVLAMRAISTEPAMGQCSNGIGIAGSLGAKVVAQQEDRRVHRH